MREARRLKWETERKEREKADLAYRQKREQERLDRNLTRKAAEDTERYLIPQLCAMLSELFSFLLNLICVESKRVSVESLQFLQPWTARRHPAFN